MIKNTEDYQVVEYVIKNSTVIPTYERYLNFQKEVGEDSLPMTAVSLPPNIMGEWDCPMHKVLRELIGYLSGYLHLHRYPNKIMHLLEVLNTKAREEIWKIALKSPAKLIAYGTHINSELTPPIFKEYFLPYFQEFAEKLYATGKKLLFHLDADTSNLLGMIKDSGCDIADCLITWSQVSIRLEKIRKIWGKNIIIWGGIPSIMLSP